MGTFNKEKGVQRTPFFYSYLFITGINLTANNDETITFNKSPGKNIKQPDFNAPKKLPSPFKIFY